MEYVFDAFVDFIQHLFESLKAQYLKTATINTAGIGCTFYTIDNFA
jgi:hypothetical protein